MNPATNELMTFGENQVPNPGFELLPKTLEKAAKLALNGKKSVFISRTSGGKLSKHAAKLRKRNRKLAQKSRKRNTK